MHLNRFFELVILSQLSQAQVQKLVIKHVLKYDELYIGIYLFAFTIAVGVFLFFVVVL